MYSNTKVFLQYTYMPILLSHSFIRGITRSFEYTCLLGIRIFVNNHYYIMYKLTKFIIWSLCMVVLTYHKLWQKWQWWWTPLNHQIIHQFIITTSFLSTPDDYNHYTTTTTNHQLQVHQNSHIPAKAAGIEINQAKMGSPIFILSRLYLRLAYKLDHELDNIKAQLALQLQLYM